MGAFDLWAWQLWWLVGLWLGVRWAKDDLHLDWVKKMTIPAATVAGFFLLLRYAQVAGVVTFGKFGLLFDKWDFGIGRMLDFTAIAALAIRFRSLLRPLAIRPLVMLGQASLPVFCVHLLCVLCALTIMGNDPILRGSKAIVVVLASLSALLLTAKIAAKRRAKAGESPPQVQPPTRGGYEPGLATKNVARGVAENRTYHDPIDRSRGRARVLRSHISDGRLDRKLADYVEDLIRGRREIHRVVTCLIMTQIMLFLGVCGTL
jgi:hypothetical protein